MYLKYVLLIAEPKQLSRLVSRDAIYGRRDEKGFKIVRTPFAYATDRCRKYRSKRRNIRVPLIPVKAHDASAEKAGKET